MIFNILTCFSKFQFGFIRFLRQLFYYYNGLVQGQFGIDVNYLLSGRGHKDSEAAAAPPPEDTTHSFLCPQCAEEAFEPAKMKSHLSRAHALNRDDMTPFKVDRSTHMPVMMGDGTEPGPYDCCYCSGEASFTVFDKLGEHVRFNHGPTYFYKCPRCAFQNRFALMLKRHLTQEHQVPKDKISMQSLERMRMDTTSAAIQQRGVMMAANLDGANESE